MDNCQYIYTKLPDVFKTSYYIVECPIHGIQGVYTEDNMLYNGHVIIATDGMELCFYETVELFQIQNN